MKFGINIILNKKENQILKMLIIRSTKVDKK